MKLNKTVKKKYLILIIIIALSVTFPLVIEYMQYNLFGFNTLCAQWNNHSSLRPYISSIFVKRNSLLGLEKNKIIELLGEPTEITNENIYIYSFRKKDLLFSYTFFLSISFDSNNLVIETDTFSIDD